MTSAAGGGGGGVGGGALSLMGCVREASPPLDHYQHHHHHHHHAGLPGDHSAVNHNVDVMPKEPKKRRFHPLRGLRRIFRRKSRGAADSRLNSGLTDRDAEHLVIRDREDVTLRNPAGRTEEIRSRSASELLTDSCDRQSIFLRRSGADESFVKFQRGGAGHLSISHDSVFPGEVPHTRPLSSLESLNGLERRQSKASNDLIHKEPSGYRHRISLRVLEQIKTAIESRNLSSSGTTEAANQLHNRFACHEWNDREEAHAKVPKTASKDTTDRVPISPQKEELLETPTSSLNHTAAHHRISVRPKNRRPPKRSTPQSNASSSPGLRIDSIAETSIDTLDSLEHVSVESSPLEPKTTGILRKSSSRLSRNSDVFEELEAKLPILRKPAVSPDSLESTTTSRNSAELLPASPDEEAKHQSGKVTDLFEKLPRRRSLSNRLSKSPDSLDSTSTGWFSKSSEGFDKLSDFERETKPVAARRLLLPSPIFKSTERVSKSSDSLEALDAMNSDDSIDRRRCSFEIRPRRNAPKLISKSTECFEVLEHRDETAASGEEPRKRASLSEVHLIDRRQPSKPFSKSTENFEEFTDVTEKHEESRWKSSRRTAHSSESSDNLELDECKLENRSKARRSTPKRTSTSSITDEIENKKSSVSCRLQKSSESSELGSTDTLDSERRNPKLSDSDETLDSLEKDQDQDEPLESITKREKNSPNGSADEEGSFWRRQDSKDNLDIHQLLEITIVSRMPENGNDDQRSPMVYPKKKQQLPSQSGSEDNKTLNSITNLLSSKNDEDLQNMLNGNISEVSDTKSFKEKLIMFEKMAK